MRNFIFKHGANKAGIKDARDFDTDSEYIYNISQNIHEQNLSVLNERGRNAPPRRNYWKEIVIIIIVVILLSALVYLAQA